MQIVIDIPEKEYKRWQDEGEMDALIVRNSLVNGTPLPKGHGDLIDRQELLKSTLCKTFGLRSVDIENAPTVIEADRRDEPSITPSYNSIKTELKSCEDCISREQAKVAIRDRFKDLPSRVEINTILNELPSVIPQTKTGHWVKEYIDCVYDVCSECGQKITTGYFEYEYCPNCGAKMEESKL